MPAEWGWRRALLPGLGLVALLMAGAASAQARACPPPLVMPSADERKAQAESARDRGLLWRLERGGRTSYLYGSLHVGRPEWLTPGPAVAAALRNTDVLALELDITDSRTAQDLADALPPSAAPPLPAALKQRLERQIEAACLDAAALRELPPLMQMLVLALAAAQWEGLHAPLGTEFVLGLQARDSGRRIVALETAAAQARLLWPERADDQQRLLEQSLAALEDRRTRQAIARLAAAWEAGRLDEIETYEQWCGCVDTADDRAQMRRLNDERNAPMADRIAALHDRGDRLFVAVGALHMTGAQALPRLLAERGFKVERLAFGR